MAVAPRVGRLPLVGLLAAEAVGFTGTRLSMIAIPWFVFTTTGSATAMGLVAFAEMAPFVVAKALSGPVIDRFGQRRVSVAADIGSCAAIGVIPLVHLSGGLSLPLLLVLVALLGMCRGPGDTAKAAMAPAVAEASGAAIERVAGLTGTMERLGQTAGPLAAGLLVAWLGPVTVLVVTTATFAVAAVVVAATAPRSAVHEVEEGGYLRQLRGGVDFLRREPLLRAIVAMISVTNMIDTAVFAVLLPLWAATTSGGAAAVGLVSGVAGAGAVLGSATAAALADRLPRRATYFLAFLVGGAPKILVLALGGQMWVVVAVWAVAGFCGGVVNPIISATVYERVPRPLLGRVLSLSGTAAYVGVPFGGLVAGALVTAVSFVPTLVVFAAAYAVTTMLPLRRAEWRAMAPVSGEPGSGAADR